MIGPKMEGNNLENTEIPSAESLARAIQETSTLESAKEFTSHEEKERIEKIKASITESLENINEIKKELPEINEATLSPEQKIRLKKVLEKIFKVIRKTVKVAEITVAAVSVLGVANYERTHDSLQKTKNEKGEIVYTHPDQETTHLLNVMAGREELTLEDKLIEYRGFLKKILENKNISTPSNFETMSINEMDAFLITELKIDTKAKPGDFKKDLQREVDVFNETFSDTTKDFKRNKDIYNLIWQLEQESGNPKVRFDSENINFTPIKDYQGARHYDPINNIVYVDSWDLGRPHGGTEEGVIAEMSHAKQFNDNQITTYFNAVTDFLGVLKESNFDMDTLSEKYRQLYRTPGSFEHEAHSVIQPYFEKKYELYTHKDNPKKY